MNAQHAVRLLCDHLLGEDWYIVDPVRNEEANDIIVDTIMKNYPPKSMTRVDKWRKRHKRCKWCTHCVPRTVIGPNNIVFDTVYDCAAKDSKSINIDIPRPFCTIFNLKKEKHND